MFTFHVVFYFDIHNNETLTTSLFLERFTNIDIKALNICVVFPVGSDRPFLFRSRKNWEE